MYELHPPHVHQVSRTNPSTRPGLDLCWPPATPSGGTPYNICTPPEFYSCCCQILSDFVLLKTRSTRDRSIPRSLQRWVSTKILDFTADVFLKFQHVFWGVIDVRLGLRYAAHPRKMWYTTYGGMICMLYYFMKNESMTKLIDWLIDWLIDDFTGVFHAIFQWYCQICCGQQPTQRTKKQSMPRRLLYTSYYWVRMISYSYDVVRHALQRWSLINISLKIERYRMPFALHVHYQTGMIVLLLPCLLYTSPSPRD